MALSCFLTKLSSSALKGPALGSLNKTLIRSISCVYIIQQPYHHQLASNKNEGKELFLKHNRNYLTTAKQFSTSSILLTSYKGPDHGKLWTFEKFLSAALLPLVPAALVAPCQALDTLLALVMVLHTHFGLEAIVIDYIRPILFGEIIPKISLGFLYLLSIITMAGLLNLIYNDVGLANILLKVWQK